MILAVNDAWRRFGAQNGAGARCGVGTNYLHVTADAAHNGDDIAATASAALSAVFDRHTPRASMDYPCHSPLAQHWFRMRAEPLPGRHDVLLTHDEITDHITEKTRLLNQNSPTAQDLAWHSPHLDPVMSGAQTAPIPQPLPPSRL